MKQNITVAISILIAFASLAVGVTSLVKSLELRKDTELFYEEQKRINNNQYQINQGIVDVLTEITK